jgi:predicted metal-dependent hydrolase
MNFTLIRKRVKNLTIKIQSDGNLLVVAPILTSEQEIKLHLEHNKSWINKRLQQVILKHKHNEQLLKNNIVYLGKYYPIIHVLADHADLKPRVNFINDKFLVYNCLHDSHNISSMQAQTITKWYVKQAKIILPDLVNKYLQITGLQIQSLSIKKMSSRWGSCNSNKKYINLNLDLIKQDIKAIEYVILHEIIHLIHPNHSINFYAAVANVMPDWKARKNLLVHY